MKLNIFNKITLESMKKNKSRTLVTIVGVVLATIMIMSVLTFAFSLQDYMIKGAEEKYGNWHVEYSDVDNSFIENFKKDKDIENTIQFKNLGYANLLGSRNEAKPYIFVAEFNNENFNEFNINLISGRLPKNKNEILIPRHVELNAGVKFNIGDEISLDIGNRSLNNQKLSQKDAFLKKFEELVNKTQNIYKVVGIYERPTFENFEAPGYTAITLDDNENFENDDNTIFLTLKNPYKLKSYLKNKVDKDYILNDDVIRFMGLSENNTFNMILYSIAGILVLIIMIGSIFLIYNTFNISLNERTKEFGILSSIGATSKQLRNSVLFEGFAVGAIFIPIGIILGIISIKIVIDIVNKNFKSILYNNVDLSLKISFIAVILTVLFSLVTTLISAYILAKKASKTPILENIKQSKTIKIDNREVEISNFSKKHLGMEEILALKNFKRNKKSYKSVIFSLVLSIVLFVAGNTFSSHIKEGLKNSVLDSDYDIYFVSEDIKEKEMFNYYNKLKKIEDINDISYQANISAVTEISKNNISKDYLKFLDLEKSKDFNVDFEFIEDSIYLEFIRSLNISEDYLKNDNKLIAVAKTKIKENDENKLINIFKNAELNIDLKSKEENQFKNVDIKFVDFMPLDTLPKNSFTEKKEYTFLVIAPYSLKKDFDRLDNSENLGILLSSNNPSKTVLEMEKILESENNTKEYSIFNMAKILDQNKNLIFIINIFTYVFVIMIALIAIANVFNTISTNIKLRKREISMLKSIGMGDKSFRKMMNFEAVFYSIKSLIYSIIFSIIISILIYKGLVFSGLEIDYIFPYKSLIIGILFVFIIIFLSMKYSIKKIESENIIDNLKLI